MKFWTENDGGGGYPAAWGYAAKTSISAQKLRQRFPAFEMTLGDAVDAPVIVT